jgi:Arc/MetJ family transcription regulator
MRTTIEISDELFRRAKKRAADEGITLREIVDGALRTYLSRRTKRAGYKLQWRAERGRMLPGVNLDDRDALFDLMDGRK